jgi:hypothetical protein
MEASHAIVAVAVRKKGDFDKVVEAQKYPKERRACNPKIVASVNQSVEIGVPIRWIIGAQKKKYWKYWMMIRHDPMPEIFDRESIWSLPVNMEAHNTSQDAA